MLIRSRLNDQPPKVKAGSRKKPAPAPGAAGKAAKITKNPLFEAKPKNFGIGSLHLCFAKLSTDGFFRPTYSS